MISSRTDTHDHLLRSAYNDIYDVKDACLDNDVIRVACYNTLSALATLMEDLNILVPQRRDGEGR